MNHDKKLHEYAHNDYLSGMKYKDIAEKYDVSINTIKSWKRRHSWQREGAPKRKKVAPRKKRVQVKETSSKLRSMIRNDLMNQLKVNQTSGAQYTDLVNDYMSMWDIKNHLIADIKERGVVVEWSNGKQQGKKKNESIGELNKTNAQMLKLLAELGLKATEVEVGEDDETPDV